MVLITLLELALPYVTKLAIDRYIVPAPSGAPSPATRNAPAPGRYLRADLTDPAVRAVVDKYPGKFVRVPPSALLRLEDIGDLAKTDLAVLRRKDLAGIGRLALLFLAIVLLDFALNFIQVLAMEYTGQMIMHDLRRRLFAHIQELSVAFFSRTPVGRLVTRVTSDIQNMNELFTSVVAFVFKDLFLLVGIMAMLIGIDWRLALICFTVLPFVLFASARFSIQARGAFRTLRVKIAEINTRFAETIGGIRVIQLFGQEQANYRAFARLNHENYQAGMQQIRIFAVFMPVIEILNATATAAVIYYGGGNVIQERISLGALVAFISYMKMFFRPIRDIAEKYNILQNAMASAERIFQILDTADRLPPPVAIPGAEGSRPPEPLRIATVSFENVAFSYLPGEPVLRSVSFEIRPGETVAVVGPTGSGKNDPGQPAAPLLRADGGTGADQRAGHPRIFHHPPAVQDGAGHAGSVPVFGHHPAQHLADRSAGLRSGASKDPGPLPV